MLHAKSITKLKSKRKAIYRYTSESPIHCHYVARYVLLEEDLEKNEVERTGKAEITKAKFLAESGTCKNYI